MKFFSVYFSFICSVNFKKNEKAYNSEGSEVLKLLKESENDPREPGNRCVFSFLFNVNYQGVPVHHEIELHAFVAPNFFPLNFLPMLFPSPTNKLFPFEIHSVVFFLLFNYFFPFPAFSLKFTISLRNYSLPYETFKICRINSN